MFILSCNKERNKTSCNGSISLVGKWQAKEQFISPGVGGSWVELENSKKFTVEFKSDDSFIYSANFPKPFYDRYNDSTSHVVALSSTTGKSENWLYSLENGCILSLNIFTCYEGCAYRLQRIE
jgi:hypothetical protein